MVTYYRQHNQLATLSPTLTPGPYTKFYIRKEYDDGLFPREFFYQASEYGGRAFSEDKVYVPLPPKIEQTVPNMHLYDPYVLHFGKNKPELQQIKRILNCAHIRLAPDSHNLLSPEELKPNFTEGVNGIFLHDYDLAALNAQDLIQELSNQRHFKTKEGINPYPIGNKYPIKVTSPEDMAAWSKIVTIPNALYLEYCGVMDDKVLYDLCMDNQRMARQILYNVTSGCSSEEEFLKERLPKIFTQVLFLRRVNIKILLKYDEQILVTKELQNLIDLFNLWLKFTYQKEFAPHTQSLYKFCRDTSYKTMIKWNLRKITMTVEEMRDIFQYIREHNYDLFKMFYEWDEVKFDGRYIVNEWN